MLNLARIPVCAALLLVLASRANAEDLRFCGDSTQCQAREACVEGLCTALADNRVPMLFPIAVDKILDLNAGKRSGTVVERIDQTLRRLLGLAGFFRVLDAERNPPEASLESLRVTTIEFERWQVAGAWAVVKGTMKAASKDRKVLTLKLFLVEHGHARPLRRDVQTLRDTSPRQLRWAIARWVDDLLVDLTGRGGAFASRIAYSKRMTRTSPKEIYVMDMDGSFERAITRNGSINMLPSWTPRGEIAYTSFLKHNPDLWVAGKRLSHYPRMNTGAAYHPDGRTLALTLSKDGDAEIYVLDGRRGKVLKRLTRNPAIDTSPTWSPDGKRIAFVSDRGGTGRPQLYSMAADGSDVSRLPQVGGYNSSPDWSPTGGRIAYSAMTGGDRYDIYSIELEGGTVRRLTSEGSNEEPSYSPDGRYIAYTSTRGGQQAIWIMTADGDNQQKVSRGEGIYMTPAWERKFGAAPR